MHHSVRPLLLLFVFGILGFSCQPTTDTVPARDQAAVARVIAEVDRAAADKEHYKRALRENTREAYDAYLAAFPDGEFSEAAREHLENRNNREQQARYALQFVLRTLRATRKARPVVDPLKKVTFRPSVKTTIYKLEKRLAKDLQTHIVRSSDRLPDVYLDQLRKALQSSTLYRQEPTDQFNRHRTKVKELYPSLPFGMKNPYWPLGAEHLRQCKEEARQLIQRFQAQGKKAVAGLDQFGV